MNCNANPNFTAHLRIKKVTALPARDELLGKAVFYRPAAAAETQHASSDILKIKNRPLCGPVKYIKKHQNTTQFKRINE